LATDAVDGDHLAGAARLRYGHRVETEPPGALDDHVVAESLINPLETVHHLGEGAVRPRGQVIRHEIRHCVDNGAHR